MMIGTIQRMKVKKQVDGGYLLAKRFFETILPGSETEETLSINEEVDVFLFAEEATLKLPNAIVGTFAWAKVTEVDKDVGALVDIGTTKNILIPKHDLPTFLPVWPEAGDQLYVTLRVTKNGELFAVPAKERHFEDLIDEAIGVELNDYVEGIIIRAAREGSVMITSNNYRGFIHRTEREREVRLGETVSARVIEVKEDGTLNLSLKPLKHKRIDQDSETILRYLLDAGGEMDYSDRSNPEEIQAAFQMSKAAFKRALGRLMKENKVKQIDGKTILINKNK